MKKVLHIGTDETGTSLCQLSRNHEHLLSTNDIYLDLQPSSEYYLIPIKLPDGYTMPTDRQLKRFPGDAWYMDGDVVSAKWERSTSAGEDRTYQGDIY